MATFVPLATLDQLPDGSAREVEHEGRIIALFHVDGSFWAIDGLCPHQGGPLADGPIDGDLVYCPWHNWAFNLKTGQSLVNPTWRQSVYHVKVEGQTILVAFD